jgi:hypothetical protein
VFLVAVRSVPSVQLKAQSRDSQEDRQLPATSVSRC